MSAKQNRKERKLIEDAVAKVREVVQTASKEDVILALHDYDFDISRTVQAFCDDGAHSALDSWERSGVNGNKKKKAAKKAKNPPNPSIKPTAIGKAVNGKTSAAPMSNGVAKESNECDRLIANAVATSGANLHSDSNESKVPPKPSSSMKPALNGEKDSPSDGFGLDTLGLRNHIIFIDSINNTLDNRVSSAEENAKMAFESVRRLLIVREKHLLYELKRMHDDGARFLNERLVQANEMVERAEMMEVMSDLEQDQLRTEIACFLGEKSFEEQIGSFEPFTCETDQLIHMIKNFGTVNSVKSMMIHPRSEIVPAITVRQPSNPVANATGYPMKLPSSTSHSSVVSSLGDDSGLGQISPIANDGKNVAEVSNGGIMMTSEFLTTKQLTDLNLAVQKTLKEQGIDASLVTGNGAVPARRRPPLRNRGGGQQQRGGKSSVKAPNLSILNR